MDLHKLTTEDIRGFDAGKLRETENDVRKAMVDIRMDIYTARNQHTAKIRGLRKTLARLLTVKGKPVHAPKAAAPVAAKAPKAPKAVNVAAKTDAAPKAKAKAAEKPKKSSTKK